jgi:KipI family sensor histidine kinase inhibitor
MRAPAAPVRRFAGKHHVPGTDADRGLTPCVRPRIIGLLDLPIMKIIPASDSSVLMVLGETTTPEISAQVLNVFRALQERQDKHIRNLHPGYVSLLVDFDPLSTTQEQIYAMIEEAALAQETNALARLGKLVEVPVCYGEEFGPDLADVASHAKLKAEEVVKLHSSTTYDVCFLGFTAGFTYLSGMPEKLSMPRLTTPRRAVAAGSVGIAGAQTGVYPTETPGGWRLIGRTPMRMFNAKRSVPTLVMPGDQIRFVPINRGEFDRLSQERP